MADAKTFDFAAIDQAMKAAVLSAKIDRAQHRQDVLSLLHAGQKYARDKVVTITVGGLLVFERSGRIFLKGAGEAPKRTDRGLSHGSSHEIDSGKIPQAIIDEIHEASLSWSDAAYWQVDIQG